MDEPMTPELAWQVCVDNLRVNVAMVKEKLAEGLGPVEIAGRLTVGYQSNQAAAHAAPGLLAVALVLLTTAEVFDGDVPAA